MQDGHGPSAAVHAHPAFPHHAQPQAAPISTEALFYQRLLNYHIARCLRKKNLSLNADLQNALLQHVQERRQAKSLRSRRANEVRPDQLDSMYSELVTRFTTMHHQQLNSYVEQLQFSETSLEFNIRNCALDIFDDNVVNWGRLVALGASIASVALRCAELEMTHVITSLVREAVITSEQVVTAFIRSNGGWPTIFRFFEFDMDAEDNSEYEDDDSNRSEGSSTLRDSDGKPWVGVFARALGIVNNIWAL